MIVLLMFLLPLVGGLLAFFIKDGNLVRSWALVVSVVTMVLALLSQFSYAGTEQVAFSAQWLGTLGSSFSLKVDGLSVFLPYLPVLPIL
jgi:NADH-quinone oxidoreductase subunit M